MKKGFVDLQVNGYLGKNFSSDKLTLDDVRFVTGELVKRGTIAFCPTLVTSSLGVYKHTLPLLAKAIGEAPEHLLGIHIEGPFISPQDGHRGAHQKKFVIKPDIDIYKKLQDLAGGNIVLVTVAPEVEGAMKLIKYISKEGLAKISLGHHNADTHTIRKACDMGASVCTHLGNGLIRTIDRHQNPLWEQLSNDRLTAMFITDGFHVPPEFIKTALRAKGLQRFIVTSDCVHLAGLKSGEYDWLGIKIVVEKNSRVSLKDAGYLAGSGSNMLQCINYLASLKLLTEQQLWKAGFDNPLTLLGKELIPKNYSKLPNLIFKKTFAIC